MPERMKETLIAPLFPPEVVTEEALASGPSGSLYPEEVEDIQRAVQERRQEFLTGRLCARGALARIGIPRFPLRVGEDRAPVWPEGVVGSITHAMGYCGVALARRGRIVGIGLDAETSDGLATDLWPMILTQEERLWIGEQATGEQGRLAKLIFSAKECFYKSLHGLRKGWLDFHDLTVRLDLDRGEFAGILAEKAAGGKEPGVSSFGRFLFAREWVMTGMIWALDEEMAREKGS